MPIAFLEMINVGGNCRRLNSFAGDSTRLRMSQHESRSNPVVDDLAGRRLSVQSTVAAPIELVVWRQRLIVKLSGREFSRGSLVDNRLRNQLFVVWLR